MKAKRLIPLLALTVCFSAFGGCTNVDEKITFGNYWNEASLTLEDINETLVYNVRFEGEQSGLANYGIDYTNGVYTTNLVKTTENGQNIYVYNTTLTIDVTYSLGSETKTLSDTVTSQVRFLTAENSLRPLSSTKKVVSASPKNGSPLTVDDCYTIYDYELTTTYAENGTSGTSVLKNNNSETQASTTYEFEIEQKKYRYLDNEQLPLAIRAIPVEKTSSTALVYSPFVNNVQKVAFSFSSEETKTFSFYRAGNTEKSTEQISCRSVTMKLDEKNPGATQTALVAYTKDPQNNKYRNVILKLETPLSYGLGTLIYELNSTSW